MSECSVTANMLRLGRSDSEFESRHSDREDKNMFVYKKQGFALFFVIKPVLDRS